MQQKYQTRKSNTKKYLRVFCRFSVEFNSSDIVEFSQFECLSSPAAAKLAKQLTMSTKLIGRINQSQYTFPRFVIGLVPLLLLPSPTIWFSLDHKRNVSEGVVSGIGTLFSLDHKLYASHYDSDSESVASENQPLERCLAYRESK